MEVPTAQFPDPKLPHGTVFFKVDALPRDPVQVTIDGGLNGGDFRNVSLSITHRDVYTGKRDITDMLVWGDVDPNFHPRIGQSSVISDWMNYIALMPIVLSAGAGTKTINCQMRSKSGRIVSGVSTYAMTANTPHISILRQNRRVALQTTTTFKIAWSCSHAFASYGVYLAPANDALIGDCMLLASGTNVSGGAGAAGQMVESSFTSADAQAVAVATSGVKDGIYPILTTGSTFIRVFATTAAGIVTS